MNNRRDELNHDRMRGGRGQDEWRSDPQRGIEDGWNGRPDPRHRSFANEGLASDFSLEGTRLSHRGKGPKGYARSDERIRELVCDALSDHPAIDASDIEVTVKDGEVTLAGTIDHRAVKRLVEDVVESVTGVVDIHNRLTMKAGR